MGLKNRPADARPFPVPNSNKGPGIEVVIITYNGPFPY